MEFSAEIRILKNTLRRFVDQELIPIEMHSMDRPDLGRAISGSRQDARARVVASRECRRNWAVRI